MKSPVIANSRTIDFSVNLKEPGDYYKFSVDIVNNGTIDAMIDSVVKTPNLTEQQAKYLKYEIEYTDGNSILDKQLLLKDTSKTMSVLVAYRSDVASSNIPTTGESLNLSFIMNYVQADETGTEIPESTPVVRVVNGDLNTVGSEICIGDECFYLIKNDDKSVTMLAKYNLLVGYKFDKINGVTNLLNPTGVQDETALGYFYGYSESNPLIGAVSYAYTNYWSQVDIFPSYVYNNNSVSFEYIENYKSYLEAFGIVINSAKLISVEELENLGCVISNKTCSNSSFSWVYSTSYWTGSAASDNEIWVVSSNGNFFYDNVPYYRNSDVGVRPVIKLSLSYF